MRLAIVLAAGLVTYGVWRYRQQAGEAADSSAWVNEADAALTGAAVTAGEWIEQITGGILKTSAMRNVTTDMVQDPNMRAMLAVIRAGEGTGDAAGYSRLFGGAAFQGFADHPRILVRKSGYSSTAAGAYQFLSSTWDETRQVMSLPDFSPASQDLGAVGRIAARGALEDVIAGRFAVAVKKLAYEWASLPGSPYGQPTKTIQQARAVYQQFGGSEYA